MKKQFHILNGDALRAQFPADIPGVLIVARECLVYGPVKGKTLQELFANRAAFLSQTYDDLTEADYFQNSASEFEKIKVIPPDSEINLWFEDDLFCQVNLWFILYLLREFQVDPVLYLIRPTAALQYGFGGMSAKELTTAYQHRTRISNSDFATLGKLWILHQNQKTEEMLELAYILKEAFPFLSPAVEALRDSLPSEGQPGRPVRTLMRIMRELDADEFGPVFQEFSRQEAIYGFGDLQVKRLYEKIINNKGA